jgi:NADH dehydrogenase/NADH:ubiquinone oxidoreductase subunit G
MDEELQSILPAFQKSAGIAIKFSHLEAYIAKLLQEKEQRNSSKHRFFSLKKEATPAQSYSPASLNDILLEDIAPNIDSKNTPKA